MTDVIKTDFALQTEAKAFAEMIIEQIESDMASDETLEDKSDEISDLVWEFADQSEHVIYYYRAIQICANCNTDEGEIFLEEMGGTQTGDTFNSIATKIAFGEFQARIRDEVATIVESKES